jgi:hypothetical protein
MMMTTIQSQRAAAVGESTHALAGWVLRINGGLLLLAGLAALTADLVGYFFAAGPFASLEDQPLAIASVEAHGLGALAGLLIWRGADKGRRWGRHGLALSVHLFLCLCNLLFWQVYTEMQILAVGIVSTMAHAVFVTAHLTCLARAGQGAELPAWVARFRRAGLYVRGVAIGTLLSGAGIHLLIVALGRAALPRILTPPVELLLMAPMFYVSVAGWLAWPWLRFRGRWHQIALAIILVYFPLGLPLHLLTITTGSAAHYAPIPPWYSLLIVPVMAAFISCLATLRLSGERAK